jgi:chromate transport protein ChrA
MKILWRIFRSLFWVVLTMLLVSLFVIVIAALTHLFPILMIIITILLLFITIYGELKENDEFKERRKTR